MKKFYLALVRGHVLEDKIDISAPIGDKHLIIIDNDNILLAGDDSTPEWHKIRMCTPAQESCVNHRPARTRLVVLERGSYDGDPVTKILLAPITGRRHQVIINNYMKP